MSACCSKCLLLVAGEAGKVTGPAGIPNLSDKVAHGMRASVCLMVLECSI